MSIRTFLDLAIVFWVIGGEVIYFLTSRKRMRFASWHIAAYAKSRKNNPDIKFWAALAMVGMLETFGVFGSMIFISGLAWKQAKLMWRAYRASASNENKDSNLS
jgi:hypothetical protein